jgi:hypothetical protein
LIERKGGARKLTITRGISKCGLLGLLRLPVPGIKHGMISSLRIFPGRLDVVFIIVDWMALLGKCNGLTFTLYIVTLKVSHYKYSYLGIGNVSKRLFFDVGLERFANSWARKLGSK